MPIYEYTCPACGLKFELLRSLSQSKEGASCPQCHNGAERIFSTFVSRFENDFGLTVPSASNPCAGCSATSCDTCNL